MTPNPTIIRAFLSDIHAAAAKACEGMEDPGLLQLSRIHPTTESLKVSRFKIGEVDEMTAVAIADANGGHNVYVEARTIRADAPGRGQGEDTVAVFAMVLDRDGDKGMAGAQFVEPSMRVETSPGNAHDWFLFDNALPYAAAKTLGDAIRQKVSADYDSAVPTQPYRVAGTPNYPNAPKIARGRVVCGTHYQNGGPVWTEAELSAAAGGAAHEPAPAFDTEPTGEIDSTVEKLVSELLPKGQRSTRFANAVMFAVERGMTAADFEALCRANPQGSAQKYLPPERKDELQKRIAEIWEPHAAKVAELDAFGAALVKSLLENREKELGHFSPLKTRLLQSSAEFVAGFVPPDYLIDGWLQRRFVYSITGMTGHGKTTIMLYIAVCVALGIKIDNREVEKCRVLFFAGENPDDIRMRWIKLCEEMGHDPADINVFFLPGTPPIASDEIRKRIHAETAKHGPFGLLIIDTSAAYFQGDDENSNTQLGNHARMLRSFVNLPGGPTVVATCHPTKNPSMDNLLPRGGGAFLAEVDGNLVCIKGDGTVSIHWHGKLRGPDFAPILFKLVPGTTEKLKDKKGRLIWTITAAPITEAEKADIEDVGRARQNELLMLLEKEPRLSLSEMAVKLDWQYKTGMPNTSLAHRMIGALVQDGLVKKKRGKITLTKAGEEEVAAAKKAKNDTPF